MMSRHSYKDSLNSMYRIWLIVVALIVYGSLYPFHFRDPHLAASPLWVLAHSWPTGFDRFVVRDIVVNLLIYIPVGLMGFLALRQHRGTLFAALGSILFALVLSSSMEMTQLFAVSRTCSAQDLLVNLSGAALGVAVGNMQRQSLQRFMTRADTASFFRPSGTLLILYTWFAYQVFPLFPHLSRTGVSDKLHILWSAGSVTPVQTITYFIEWLVVARLLESLLGTMYTRWLIPLLALVVLPAKLLIVGRTFTWSEVIGAGLACICWSLILVGYAGRTAVLAYLVVGVLILQGLAPYHWSSAANPFSWVPFRGFLDADREFGLLSFLRKCFWYGTAIWLFRAAGWRLARAAVFVAVVLGVIEVVQIHLPGRVAEVTDPVLALVLAAILGLADRPQGVPARS
jgi:VanZ family protein